MYEWRKYYCESHGWKMFFNIAEIEKDSHKTCQHGEEATMLSKYKPASVISARLLNTSTFDEIRNQEDITEKYHVVIECLADGWVSISRDTYPKDEAFELAKRFCGMRKEAAMKIWQKKGFGDINSGFRINYD